MDIEEPMDIDEPYYVTNPSNKIDNSFGLASKTNLDKPFDPVPNTNLDKPFVPVPNTLLDNPFGAVSKTSLDKPFRFAPKTNLDKQFRFAPKTNPDHSFRFAPKTNLDHSFPFAHKTNFDHSFPFAPKTGQTNQFNTFAANEGPEGVTTIKNVVVIAIKKGHPEYIRVSSFNRSCKIPSSEIWKQKLMETLQYLQPTEIIVLGLEFYQYLINEIPQLQDNNIHYSSYKLQDPCTKCNRYNCDVERSLSFLVKILTDSNLISH